MGETTLSLAAVDKFYGARGPRQVHAVCAMSLDVDAGEIVALLGSSGCGKTSTLRMIAGFEEVSNGSIDLAGRTVHTLPPAQRNVAMAFEGYALYPPLTVRENIAFALKSTIRDAAEVDRRVTEVAHLLEIEPLLERYPSSLSGGQQQRASLGRALVREADLYLLDEPMGQLEPQLRAVLRGRLKHFLKERGMTAILVTHDQTEANALADRIAVMEGGVLQQFATPLELKERPANLFVGTFIGEPPMNVIEADVNTDGDGISFALPGGLTLRYGGNELNPAVREAAVQRRHVTIGVRPYAVALTAEGLPARIVTNQWLGDQTHIAVEFADQVVVAVEHDRMRTPVGASVHFHMRASDLHMFDTGSGDAISHGDMLT